MKPCINFSIVVIDVQREHNHSQVAPHQLDEDNGVESVNKALFLDALFKVRQRACQVSFLQLLVTGKQITEASLHKK